MTFSTDWDIDYYKTSYESQEHWALRRAFMLKHKDKYPEDDLVCLAQIFTNVEFLGCKYPDKTMEKVHHLSSEVAKDFRKSRATKLKRTFVGAQDAAGAKVKRIPASKCTDLLSNKQHCFFVNLQKSMCMEEIQQLILK